MKYFVILIALFLALGSCKKEPSNNVNPNPPQGVLYVTKMANDTVYYEATDITALFVVDELASKFRNTIAVTAKLNGDYFTFNFSCWEFEKPPANGVILRTYDFGSPNQDTIDLPNTTCLQEDGAYYCDLSVATHYLPGGSFNNTAIYEGHAGTLTITQNILKERSISGNFAFKAINAVTEDTVSYSGSFSGIVY